MLVRAQGHKSPGHIVGCRINVLNLDTWLGLDKGDLEEIAAAKGGPRRLPHMHYGD